MNYEFNSFLNLRIFRIQVVSNSSAIQIPFWILRDLNRSRKLLIDFVRTLSSGKFPGSVRTLSKGEFSGRKFAFEKFRVRKFAVGKFAMIQVYSGNPPTGGRS